MSAPDHHTIESIEVTGGYLRGVRLDFAPGMNCIIGPRGSGKTSLVELIRFALDGGAPRTRNGEPDEFLKCAIGSGRAIVRVRTEHGVSYEARRGIDESAQVRGPRGDVASGALDRELFRIEVYGQSQIEGIGVRAREQLELLDRFVEADVRRIEVEMASVRRRLLENADALLELERDIAAAEADASDLPDIEEALRGLRRIAAAEAPASVERALESKARRTRERAALDLAARELGPLRQKIDALASEVNRRLGGGFEESIRLGENGEIFAVAGDDVARSLTQIEEGLGKARAGLEAIEASFSARDVALSARHATQEDSFRALMDEHDEDKGRAADRDRLEKRHAELSARIRGMDESKRQRASRAAERKTLLASLTRLRAERFALRSRVAEDLSRELGREIRISILPDGSIEAYEALLAEVFRGANIRPATLVGEIARSIRPIDLALLVEQGDPTRIMALDPSKTRREERAREVIEIIRASGRRFEIEAALLEDLPLIELRTGETYLPSSVASMGQSCTCVLPILLLGAKGPLLIDQPEDHLDNAFICDVILKSVERARRLRQLVFITHNPNIPVLGDADRIFVLDSDGEHGRVVAAGTVDEVRDSIERLLEGGRQAFQSRGRRYGHAT